MIDSPKLVIDVDDVVGEYTPLILQAPTGIVYTAQCGGMSCSHPRCEGFVLSLSKDFAEEILDLDCEMGCEYLQHQDNRSKRDELAQIIDSYLEQETNKWRYKIRFDFERIDLMEEGWWPVKAKGRFDDFYDTYLDHKGFIHTGNCD